MKGINNRQKLTVRPRESVEKRRLTLQKTQKDQRQRSFGSQTLDPTSFLPKRRPQR